MSRAAHHDPESPPSRKLIEDQLERILASPLFAKSERMCRFLRFIVDTTLAGNGDDLKEYAIALKVFDKDESFDPRIDPTVRSEARRLRAKLADYYEDPESGKDVTVIDLPKGSYVPMFRLRSPAVITPEARSSWDRRYLALILTALAIVGALTWRSISRRPLRAGPHSIAVLPFENLSPDPANGYFSDGLTDEILNALANAPGFRVAARTSAFQFKGKHEDVRSIGKKLNVDMVLEGSVRKDGTRIRITPQLINAADGYHLWSAEFDREWKDLFTVQREIASTIATSLGGKLGHVSPQPADAGTYWLYLEGRHHFDQWNASGMLKAIGLFEQVTTRDPNYAPAYAGLADAYGLLSAFGSNAIPVQVSRAKAKTAALKAIELDPSSAEAWASLGPKLVEELDWKSAENAFRKALQLGPNSWEAHAWYAELYLTPMLRLDEALRESQTAAALDPISPYAMAGVGRRYYFLRQYDSAIVWFRKALDLEPHFHMAVGAMLHAYLCKGDRAGARQFLENLKPVFPERALARFWPQLDAEEGNRAEALKFLSSLDSSAAGACQVAAIYASLGDQARLMSSLERLIDDRSACFQWIPADPLYDRWHATPEFAALIRKMKLNVSH